MDVILDSDMYKYKNDIKQHSVDVVSFNSTEKKNKKHSTSLKCFNLPQKTNKLTIEYLT